VTSHPGPRKYRPPNFDGLELGVHAHRAPPGIMQAERALVCIFLRHYVVWSAKARRFDWLRNSLDPLTREIQRLPTSVTKSDEGRESMRPPHDAYGQALGPTQPVAISGRRIGG